ncbi:unnamed protein product [Aphanomyces euteiches]|uniref:NADH:ubiquinone oxidoreductase intermediate-associated protein 30 domain-containing protein n=1 Tax=Aphanomyces euteiches TaxID=100861 RepID=A0A6G0WX23_9STRA|nr:hypothetical protein Ae201684_010778 [Aphanomyces euteiches]KAH9061397.1 hypothetical protein Ae201684P_020733 [Aphanomyces euteiches]KAH9155804.1 hypothetical protein AeRB84_002249 [Aphanomyces euteiches]
MIHGWWYAAVLSAMGMAQGFADEDESNWCQGFDEVILSADSTIFLEEQSISSQLVGGGRRLMPHVAFNNTVLEDDYMYYQVCIARHEHEHMVHVNLTNLSGEANMYLSTEDPLPQRGRAAWIAQHPGNDSIALPTYLPEFPRQAKHMALYIGVFGYGPGPSEFNLTVSIHDLPENSDIKRRQEYYDKQRQQLLQMRRLRSS